MPSNPVAERSEWIVEARLPARHVEFARSADLRRAVPVKVATDNPGTRESSLRELFDYLESILAVKPVLLRAAGAVSVTASPAEIDRISSHPLVKRIEPNRRRRLGG